MIKETEIKLSLEEIIEKCGDFIDCIYRLNVNITNPTTTNVLWKITSNKITGEQHFENGIFRFQGETLLDALTKFFIYLKENKKIK